MPILSNPIAAAALAATVLLAPSETDAAVVPLTGDYTLAAGGGGLLSGEFRLDPATAEARTGGATAFGLEALDLLFDNGFAIGLQDDPAAMAVLSNDQTSLIGFEIFAFGLDGAPFDVALADLLGPGAASIFEITNGDPIDPRFGAVLAEVSLDVAPGTPTPVPVPPTILLMLTGTAGLLVASRRRRRSRGGRNPLGACSV